jgi:class 3 adenylate cyclase/tetratricopeptide (TPR) repeat protein
MKVTSPEMPTGRSVAVSVPDPVTERRVVTVLFADLVGFTPFAEERDAEEVRDTLTRYFELASDVIGRYGGTVEKFIGDAVMAVWGAPAAHEDDAERAVRAGLELVDAVRSLGPSMAARAGILTGEAAVTLGAANQGMVAGDLVNTASRLQTVAPPGTVFVGEATHRAAARAIAFEEAGGQVLKGKTSPVPAWRALRVVAERGGRNRSEALETPFVGRDNESRHLKDLFHATGRDRRARLVSVIGPAGIGKTRLAWEFLKYVDGLADPVLWHDGRSPAYGEGITFWALGEMVRGRCGLQEADDEPTTRAKIAETLASSVPDAEERRWIEPALLTLLGVESDVRSEQLFGAWRTFFERLAATAPVVMVFEDFHYADAGLINFVDHLLEWSRTSPIYVLTLSRPELVEKRPDWGAGKRNFTSIYLEPLAHGAMRDLLAGLVPGLPASAVTAIVERADGIPLYAVETVRMLLSEGRLALEGGAYRPVGDLTNLAVPETLTALIASRLDALAPADRVVVSDAAVLGQSFTLAGLSAVSGIAPNELEARLGALIRREILAVDADPRSPERGQYAFVQALIREVAYNTLAKPERRRRHLAAARYFEGLETDELAGALASHYLAAYRNAAGGPEADALAAQARIALRTAAQRASGLGAYDQALTFLDQALTVTTDTAETADLLELAGEAATRAGRHESAETHLRRAIGVRRELGERASIARATAALGRSLITAYQARAALAVLEPAAEEFADLAAEPAGIDIGGSLARALMLDDQSRRAIEAADRVLEAAEHADLPVIVADALITRGTALAELGRPIEGLAAIAAGRDLAESLGLDPTVLRADNNRAEIEAARDPRAALGTARAGLALARRLGIPRVMELTTYGWESGLRTGDWAAIHSDLHDALAEEFEPADRVWLLRAAAAELAVRGKPVDDALDEIRRLVAGSDDSQLHANVAVAEGFAAFTAGDLDAARAAWHEATALSAANMPTFTARAARAALWSRDASAAGADLQTLAMSGFHGPAVEADRVTIRAGIAALEGRSSEALATYREAMGAWRTLGLAWDEALCGIDMATLLDPVDPEVRVAAEAAREILVRLGATPFLERLETAVQGESSAEVQERAGHPEVTSV